MTILFKTKIRFLKSSVSCVVDVAGKGCLKCVGAGVGFLHYEDPRD